MKRFEIYLVNFNPSKGSEINKNRPAIIISPDEMNNHITTVIVAPMTTKLRGWPTRIGIEFNKKRGQVALDQIRAVDKSRLTKKLGYIHETTGNKLLKILQEIFA